MLPTYCVIILNIQVFIAVTEFLRVAKTVQFLEHLWVE